MRDCLEKILRSSRIAGIEISEAENRNSPSEARALNQATATRVGLLHNPGSGQHKRSVSFSVDQAIYTASLVPPPTRHEVRLYAQAGITHRTTQISICRPTPTRSCAPSPRPLAPPAPLYVDRCIGSVHTLAPIRHRPHRRGHTNAHTHRASCLPRAAPPSTPLRVLTGPHRARSAEHRTRPWRRRAGCRCSHCRRPGCRCPRTRPSPSSA